MKDAPTLDERDSELAVAISFARLELLELEAGRRALTQCPGIENVAAAIQRAKEQAVATDAPTSHAAAPEPRERVKLERRCPRCHAHRYHFARKYLAANYSYRGPITRRVEIDCAECGHTWKGKYVAEEWA